jgi:putative NADH-flavin reductase
MSIVVFAASGAVGRRLVELALAVDYWVTAALRNPTTVTMTHARLQVLACDVLDTATIEQVIAWAG